MMYASLHCTDYPKTSVDADWVRRHPGEPVGTQDYFRVQVETDDGQVTLFLTPDQLDLLATKLAQAGLDRQVVVEEEANTSQRVETGGGG